MHGRISSVRALLRLPDPVRVGELRAADPDEVGLPRREGLLREVRMADPTGDDEGDTEIALQQCPHLEREPFARRSCP